MALNFNVDPYYDDFDPTKNFHRILFKPGYAVQARELTQSQTILQDQISKFGNGIYKDGSKVSGANIFVDAKVITVKLTSASVDSIAGYADLYVVGQTSGFIAQVIDIDDVNLYLKTKAINVANGRKFSSGETINFFNSKVDALASLNTTVTARYTDVVSTSATLTRLVSGEYLSKTVTISTGNISIGDTVSISSVNYTGTVISITDNNTLVLSSPIPENLTNASAEITNEICVNALEVGIDEGVWFTGGYFVRNSALSIVPEALNAYPSVVVGFEVNETIYDSFSDPTLLDPAIGASNYQAPGADRYSITLDLVTKPYVSDQVVANLTTNKFIELVRISQGVVQDINNVPVFTSISKQIAQAVSDQAGDFVVNPFSLLLGTSASTSNTLGASISAGKAYLNGSPVEHISQTPYQLEKARDKDALVYQDISTYYGDYTTVKNLKGTIINFDQGDQVELHNVAFGAANSHTVIGTARVRNFDYDSGSGTTTQYNMFLFDVAMSHQNFSNVASIIIPDSGNYSTPTFSANTVAPVSLVDNNYNSLVFPLPQKNIANVSSVNYVTHRYYYEPTFSGGVVTINTNSSTETFVGGSGSISSAERQRNYMVMVQSTSGAYTAGTLIPMDQANVTITITNSPGIPQATINIGGGFNGAATIMATISEVGDTVKSKVLNANTAVEVSANSLYTAIDIGKSDIYKFSAVYETGNTHPFQGTWDTGTSYNTNDAVYFGDGTVYVSLTTSNAGHSPNTSPSYWSALTNAIDNYTTDDGQRDAYYDHGSIKNVSGSAKGNVVVVFDYFTHSGGQGFCSVDSYAIDYADIPTFTSPQYGTSYPLRDVLDFRPRRTDGIGATGFDDFQLPAPFNNVFVDYGYYLSRTDKIILYPNGQFKTLRGISSYINPTVPADVPGAFTAFTVNYPAYTFSKNDILVQPNTTRRYTMKDIGILDKRLFNLEYYTSLSVLENQVTGQDVTDSTGANLLFKNGFLVDSFKGQGVGDVLNKDYATSIDMTKQLARPMFTSNVVSYMVDTNQGTFITSPGRLNDYLSLKNNIVTFSYNEKKMIYQNVATQMVNVNPFNVVSFVGNVKLTPSSDVWYDNSSQPNINIVNEDMAAWQAAVGGTGHGTQWNDWSLGWTGQNPVQASDTGQVTRDTDAITKVIASKGLTGAVNGGNIQVSSTTKIISNAVIPYARTIPVSFEVNGMAPHSRIHTFLDGINVDAYVTPNSGYSTGLYYIDITDQGTGYTDGNNKTIITISGNNILPAIATANVVGGKIVAVDIIQAGLGYTSTPTITVSGANTHTAVLTANTSGYAGAQLVTDSHGTAAGKINIPNNEFIKLPTGPMIVEFGDNIFTPMVGSTYAKTTFYTQGTLNSSQTTVVSTRPPKTSPKSVQVVERPTTIVTPPVDTTPTAKPTYTNDALNPGSSTYEIGSTKQNNYINTYVNTAANIATSRTDIRWDSAVISDVYNNSILPVLQANLPPGYSTPTGSMAQAATLFVVNSFLSNGGNDAALATAIADLTKLCKANSKDLQAVATNYLQDPSVAKQNAAAAAAANKSCGDGIDPLSQNFYINGSLYPNGVFVSSVDLFFASKDPTIPVNVRIRPTVNGFPDAVNDIPGTLVYKNPADINVPASNLTSGIGDATKFTFDYPIFLKPGEYTLMVATDSNKYTMYASKVGEVQYGTTNLVTQLNYLGSLFKSQNAATWVPAPGETLAFVMNICDFAVGSVTFDIQSEDSDLIEYDLLHLMTGDLTFSSLDSINYQILTRKQSDHSQSPATSVVSDQNYTFTAKQKQDTAGDIIVRATVTNTDRWTSPVIDLERMNTILVSNKISPYINSSNTTSELTGGIGSGTATARYITRRVTLNNNFDSTGLTVFMDVNRQPGTKIEVYYKVLNGLDSNAFDDQPYVLMNPILTPGSGVAFTGPFDWTSDTYQALDITYNDITTGATYTNFKVFAIKVVMYSDNTTMVPQIKNFRAVATA